ncbi:MBL fold metallo-hydrolase [Halorubrum ezzemoulense]|uniref:MBL fold metallo-hydrolase n=1 Tax=Halorubrum ezzemoulense TaxID=337243 RepID=A0ABT4YXZ0_HALEZ|nr:MBL fold metallo-hydrolase [Halorubrum ezzemoulense]MDB2245289.1 MBL fold metallo-hydrolase [Halorubrum ezzemoulense]MDB2250175.1 MBL fold metallo-hydrolase [Halorubrum ezzemoulense]MDB2279333.1 MBL fold metallo-hydrolase [Halorubrum ezzemoulense]MDB2285409.1 MBL fold metallo-hydrolase [Halorubrum ezzemoulense]MDB2287245.1 MBL fold metallo-hydrolase [Halorubrum ezzemoulense]
MATEIADGVWRLDCGGVNAYLVFDDVPTLVDAGTPWDEGAIRGGLSDAGVDLSAIGRVLLTHYDLDHVGTLAALTPELDAPVHAYGFDAQLLRGYRTPPLGNHKGLIQRLGGLVTDLPELEIVGVRDGDAIGSFTAYHTPGHTPGHVAYVSEELGVALLGDLVSESDGELTESGWVISYDTGAVAASVRSLAERAPAFDVACVGHGDPLASGGDEALRRLAATL